MNEVIRLLESHRSIRRYTDENISDDHVRAAVAAGQRAASSSNVQAYCLIRVRDPGRRHELAALCGNQTKVERAPAMFVVCGDTRRHRIMARQADAPYEARIEAFLVATIDATLFAQNVVVALESLGYGTCFIGGLRNDLPAVHRLLEFPEGVFPLFGLCVGRPAQDPGPKPRLPLDAILMEERYVDDTELSRLLVEYDKTMTDYFARRGSVGARWSENVVGLHEQPRRTNLADYYRSQGARLD